MCGTSGNCAIDECEYTVIISETVEEYNIVIMLCVIMYQPVFKIALTCDLRTRIWEYYFQRITVPYLVLFAYTI